jgi:PAS domain S-box-containing protein
MLDPHVVFEAVRDESGAIVDFTYVEANPAACASNRLSRRDLIGARLLERLPGVAASGLLQEYCRVVETGEPLLLDGVTHGSGLSGGEQSFYDIRAVRLGDGLSVIWRDVTDAHAALEALRVQRDLAVALSSVRDLHEALELTLEAALSLDGVDCGGVYLVDQLSGGLELVVHEGLSPEFAAVVGHFPADAPNTRIIMAGVSIFASHEDLVKEIGTKREVAEGLRAFAAVPVRHEGSVAAAVNLASRRLDEFSGRQRALIETLTAQVGGVLARLLAEQSLRENEGNDRLLADYASEVVFRVRNDRLEWVSPSITALSGWRPDELHGQPPTLFVHPDDQALFVRAGSAAGEGAQRVDLRLRDVEGRYRRVAMVLREVADEESGRALIGTVRGLETEVEARRAAPPAGDTAAR